MSRKEAFLNGTKYYKSNEGGLDEVMQSVIRISSYDESKKIYTAKNKSNDIIHLTENELKNDWTRLIPDAMIMMCIVTYDDMSDVLFCVHKREGSVYKAVPDVVCRQNILDVYSGNTNTVGMCISHKTKLDGVGFEEILQYHEMDAMYISMAYIDDTIDDILEYTNSKRADAVLRRLKENYYSKYKIIKGSYPTLKELLMNNQFMSEYHMMFDIVEVPFSLKWKDLLPKQALVDIIAEISRKVPSAFYIIPYDKSIDLKKFERDYILATADPVRANADDRDIYIVGYDIDENISYTDYKHGGIENLKQKIRDIGFS